MLLNGNVRALFDACARAIVSRDPNPDLNLFSLNRERNALSDETVEYLADAVEVASRGKETIRRADVALFADQVMGPNLYLVVCGSDTPRGIVAELGDEMILVSLGPYSNGLTINAKRSTSEAMQRYRDFVAQGKRERKERDQSAEDAAAFMSWLTSLVSRYALTHGRPELVEKLRPGSTTRLDDLAGICRKLGVSLQQLVDNTSQH